MTSFNSFAANFPVPIQNEQRTTVIILLIVRIKENVFIEIDSLFFVALLHYG